VHFQIPDVVVVDETDKKARRDRGKCLPQQVSRIFASLPPILGLQDMHEQPIMGDRILFLYATGGKHFCKFILDRRMELRLKTNGP